MWNNLVVVALTTGALAACSPVSPAPSAQPPAASDVHVGQVIRVVDGDTFHVWTNGRDVTTRVLGLDTPETKKPQTPVQCYGPQASANAHRLLDGQTVTLRPDPTQAKLDRYGRTLAYVTLFDGSDYSLTVVAAGFGRAYKVSGPAPQEWSQLVAAQQQAQTAKTGLWAPRPQGCDGGV